MKIEVANTGGLDPTPIAYEFDVTIVDFCRDSALTFSASQADESYVIDAVAITAEQSVSFVGVTTSTDATRCPISVDLQIFDGLNWINYVGSEASYPWINDYVSGSGFDIQTDDSATYANPASAKVVFNCRVVA